MSRTAKNIAPSIRKLLAVMPLDALKETECSFLQGMNRKGINTPACQLFLQDLRKEQARRREVAAMSISPMINTSRKCLKCGTYHPMDRDLCPECGRYLYIYGSIYQPKIRNGNR